MLISEVTKIGNGIHNLFRMKYIMPILFTVDLKLLGIVNSNLDIVKIQYDINEIEK